MMLETAFCGGDGPSSLQYGVYGRDADPRPIHLRRCERLAAARMVGLARGNAELRSSLRRPGCAAPRGHGTHHYRFRLLALDISSLPVGRRPKCAKAEGAARRHVDVVAEAVLIGTFSL